MKATMTHVSTVMSLAPMPRSIATLSRYGTARPEIVTTTMATTLRAARRR